MVEVKDIPVHLVPKLLLQVAQWASFQPLAVLLVPTETTTT
jgi:hypothetical protein